MKKLTLVVDMYGCPNRCKHCWLGHMPNRTMSENSDTLLVDYFKPYFDSIAYYSWVREPDYCEDYRQRWIRDNEISVQEKPMRFDLASFYRLVRDKEYVKFLKEVGTTGVQLTFFGLEKMTDYCIGREGAYQELLAATEILLENEIAPTWQAFLYEDNKEEVVQLLDVIRERRLRERCASFGKEFRFFVHEGSCDGENAKRYDVRIRKENIPQEIAPYYNGYEDGILEERECVRILSENHEKIVFEPSDEIVLNVDNEMNVYYNYTHMTKPWIIGNVLKEDAKELVRKITQCDTFALNALKKVSHSELVAKYGDPTSTRVFSQGDYEMYMMNRYLEDVWKETV